MRSSLISASRFLSVTSVALVVLAGAGCPSDDAPPPVCGPGDAPASGLIASSVDVMLTYGSLAGGLNNDCPDPAAPTGVTSLSIAGTQSGGSGLFTICIARPDLLATRPLALGINNQASEIRIIDFSGAAAGCTFTFDNTLPPTGTASTTGLCDNAANPAGFALIVDGTVSLRRNCGGVMDQVTVTLAGTVAVTSTD